MYAFHIIQTTSICFFHHLPLYYQRARSFNDEIKERWEKLQIDERKEKENHILWLKFCRNQNLAGNLNHAIQCVRSIICIDYVLYVGSVTRIMEFDALSGLTGSKESAININSRVSAELQCRG